MQASKIRIDQEYAVEQNSRLWRFRVKEVVTTRFRDTGSPHDYRSVVQGTIVETNSAATLDPDALKGPYQDYIELVARKQQENAEHEREKAEGAARAERLIQALYALTGLEDTREQNEFRAPFRVQYGRCVEVTEAGIQPLLDSLDRVVAAVGAADRGFRA